MPNKMRINTDGVKKFNAHAFTFNIWPWQIDC